jgi:TPR repeat protein
MYEYGQGVAKDNMKAIEYYKACKGEKDAEERIVKLSN